MSKPKAHHSIPTTSGYETSWKRCAVAALLVLLGIAWIVVFQVAALDNWEFEPVPGVDIKEPDTPFPWMSDLGRWNYVIGFGLIFLGLIVSAHRTTPLGRGRGVVVGMLGCFLLGLVWIVVFYFVGQEPDITIPVIDQLDQSNLLVGIGFMAVGFTFATKWE